MGRPRHDDTNGFLAFLGKRLGIAVALCAAGCTLLLAIVYWGSGFVGPWLAVWLVLVVTSLVGLFFGLLISALCQAWQSAAVAVVISLVPMIALGGLIWPLPNMSPPIKLAASVMPVRWAFEGVLLLELPDHKAPTLAEGPGLLVENDLIESLFPARSERMGARADVMALAAMLIGLAAATVFISTRPQPSP